jgi:hypothetical protein
MGPGARVVIEMEDGTAEVDAARVVSGPRDGSGRLPGRMTGQLVGVLDSPARWEASIDLECGDHGPRGQVTANRLRTERVGL